MIGEESRGAGIRPTTNCVNEVGEVWKRAKRGLGLRPQRILIGMWRFKMKNGLGAGKKGKDAEGIVSSVIH